MGSKVQVIIEEISPACPAQWDISVFKGSNLEMVFYARWRGSELSFANQESRLDKIGSFFFDEDGHSNEDAIMFLLPLILVELKKQNFIVREVILHQPKTIYYNTTVDYEPPMQESPPHSPSNFSFSPASPSYQPPQSPTFGDKESTHDDSDKESTQPNKRKRK